MKSRLLAMAVVFSFLAGCGGGSNAPKSTDTSKSTSTKDKNKRKPHTANPDVKPGDVTEKDKEDSKKLMADGGRWLLKETDDEGTVTEYTEIYLPAGILNEIVDGETTSGTWEVRDGYIIYSLNGVKTADKIKEVNDKEFLYVDHETQKTVIETKIK